MSVAPVDYGSAVAPDESGVNAQEQALSERRQVFAQADQLGAHVAGGAEAVTQGILHTQALKATAAVKERQASTLQFIDSNPYVPKGVLQQRMSPEDYQAWHAGLSAEYRNQEAVPMFTAAGALFDSEAKQARAEAGDIISLPGWRGSWAATEETESSTIRERYVNRLAADQMIADHRGQALLAIDKMTDNATTPADFDTAGKAAETNPWLKPAERKFTMEKIGVAKDSFATENFIRANDQDGMRGELLNLQTHPEKYPNLSEKQRMGLAQELQHRIKTNDVQQSTDDGISWARGVADRNMFKGSSVINRTAAQEEFKSLSGDPVKVKAAESELDRLMSEGDKAQQTLEGRAFTNGVEEIAKTGHISADTRRVLSNSYGTPAAGAYHERLMQLEQSKKGRNPEEALARAQAWTTARNALHAMRTSDMTWEQFMATPVSKDGDTIGSTLHPKDFKPMQNLFFSAQGTEKKNDAHPLTPEVGKQIRLIMKDAFGTDPAKTLTPEELAIHARIEQHVLDQRNRVQDTGGKVGDEDYAKWINEEVQKPQEFHVLQPSTWGSPWRTKSPAEAGEPVLPHYDTRPTQTIDGETAHWDGKQWVPDAR